VIRVNLCLVGALLSLLVTGCVTVRTAEKRGGAETPVASVMPVPSARTGKGGAVLLIAEVKHTDDGNPDLVCRWRMINQESGRSFFLDVKAGSPRVYTQLDPGTYKAGRLGCGIARVWDIDDVFKEGFRVEDGLVSYLGKLVFEFKKNELDTVRKASRTESAKAFVSALSSTPAANQGVISGFTGRRIERGMVEGSGAQEGFDVYAKGTGEANQLLEPLVNHLRNCAKDSSAQDPLRFGRLEYVAVYKDGRFNEMKARNDSNGFSDKLRSCVERGMMAFHPTAKNEIEVRVRY